MAPTKNTRGNKNTATIQPEDQSMADMRETTKERFELTKESIQVKATYQRSFVQLKSYNKVIKTFLKEYGQQLNIKELASLIATNGYKAENFEELTLENLQKIFVKGKVYKTITVKVPGTFTDGTEKKTVAMDETDLKQIMADIANLNLSSFKNYLGLIDTQQTYTYTNQNMNNEQRAAATKRQEAMIDYVVGLKKMDLPALCVNFFAPLLLELASKTNLAILTIVQKIKEVHEAFVAREALIDAIYKSSSAEAIAAINNDEYKCQNPNNNPEITKNNNKVIQKISGEDDNLDLPQETAVYSDFVFHSEHAASQCELQETMRLEKNFHAAQANILAIQILRDCSQAQIKELNTNYDLKISELSTSTAVAISNNNQEKCEKLEKNYHTFDANIALVFAYKTSDDAEILAAMEKVKPIVSLDTEGQATISETSLKAKHTTDSANIKGFAEIRDDLSKINENAVMRAIIGKKNLNLDDQISSYKDNESEGIPAAAEVALSTLTCAGNLNDSNDCIPG